MQQQRCIVITKNIISIQGCANFLCYTFVLWRYVCSTHQSKVYCNLNWFHHLLLKGSAAPSTCSVEQHLHTNNVFRLNNFPINQLHHRIAYDGKALLPSLRTDHHHHEFPRSSRERTTKKKRWLSWGFSRPYPRNQTMRWENISKITKKVSSKNSSICNCRFIMLGVKIQT